ncbi:hypothetical protein GCM10009644_36540 [Microbacterium oxydans]
MDEPSADTGGDAELPGRGELTPAHGERAHVGDPRHRHGSTCGDDRIDRASRRRRGDQTADQPDRCLGVVGIDDARELIQNNA